MVNCALMFYSRTPSRFLPRFGGFSAIKLATDGFAISGRLALTPHAKNAIETFKKG